MPRRSPPTALRLVQGPLPPRSQPRHTLPSVPRPVFQPVAYLPRGPSPTPRPRIPGESAATYSQLPPLDINFSSAPSSNSSSPVLGSSPASGSRVRGPWDHHRSIELRVDIDSILKMPMPVVVGA
ncbi:hypothetical protein SERLADRAFT_474423 [Serpula lacrymans var. lacrymans S7.9]|uniref:Uncharacterized protein n=1 Tax=Serpula lacrymans var. lacrymans (strain S7.9) TaxID=578457 RepID=F8P503_SERL9|nr:uncharacterized protein SERLADRAFT_474423 [Serpula lacrymans var. lacrymans S7.9]EGO21690.1 hypothetical protein SERLADRAFT_474423 [Serpula lacrymans var. lacrymans S7.9]